MRLLVVGSPRSGTTLLASMLGAHSEISMLLEDPGLMLEKLAGTRVVGNKVCIPNQIDLRRRAGWARRGARRIGAPLAKFMPPALSFLLEPASRYSIRDYLLLGNTRLVGIIRSGSDTVASMMRRNRTAGATAAYRWLTAVTTLHELAAEPDVELCVVSYEGLVSEPEQEMKRLAAFLDVDFEEPMLSGFRFNTTYPGRTAIGPSPASEAPGTSPAFSRAVLDQYAALLERSKL